MPGSSSAVFQRDDRFPVERRRTPEYRRNEFPRPSREPRAAVRR